MTGENQAYIQLIAYDIQPERHIVYIGNEVSNQFNLPIKVVEMHEDLGEFFDPFRKQYDGNKLLKHMETLTETDSLKTMGIFHVDLFIPILTYIFGQAFLNGKVGIASMYRLRNELYGMPHDEDLLLERFTKVVIHELGHSFGLKHCHVPKCIMISSTYVEDLDQKSNSFCPHCRTVLDGMMD